jgi:hypothetical protein
MVAEGVYQVDELLVEGGMAPRLSFPIKFKVQPEAPAGQTLGPVSWNVQVWVKIVRGMIVVPAGSDDEINVAVSAAVAVKTPMDIPQQKRMPLYDFQKYLCTLFLKLCHGPRCFIDRFTPCCASIYASELALFQVVSADFTKILDRAARAESPN